MSKSRMVAFMLMCTSLLFINALAEDENNKNYSVNISEDKFLGSYLVNETGFTLYYHLNDSESLGMSTCNDECAATWQPFYVEDPILPENLNFINFDSIQREDGSKQTTFKDWPLYLYSGDSSAGDVRGEGLEGDTWHVVDPMNQPELM